MFIYSKRIFAFINEIKLTIKTILKTEVGLKVRGDWFSDKTQTASYPIKIVIFNTRSMLGYFDPNFLELGFHETLMNIPKKQLYNIIRHEIAHYLTFIQNGIVFSPHGNEFKKTCQNLGWDEEISKASVCLESNSNVNETIENPMVRKVKKLMALASSSNQFEAEQAMLKSQQLLLNHNIDVNSLGQEEEEIFCLKRILKQKKDNAKLRSIASILQTFFVTTVYLRAGDHIYLEIVGNRDSVDIAEYVGNFLDNELENLWNNAQKNNFIQGTVAKNSFFTGVALGYCDKVKSLKRTHEVSISKALMVIESKLELAKEMIYPHLRSTYSKGKYCSTSSYLGQQVGRELNINPALNASKTKANLLLK